MKSFGQLNFCVLLAVAITLETWRSQYLISKIKYYLTFLKRYLRMSISLTRKCIFLVMDMPEVSFQNK